MPTMEASRKRERSSNFNKDEVRLLTSLVTKHLDIIENKKTDMVTNKNKEATWNKISRMFNASSGLTHRSVKTLKLKYESLKKVTKKKISNGPEPCKTCGREGEAPTTADLDETMKNILAMSSNITDLDSHYDENHISEYRPKPHIEVVVERDPQILLKSEDDSSMNEEDEPIQIVVQPDMNGKDENLINGKRNIVKNENANGWTSHNPFTKTKITQTGGNIKWVAAKKIYQLSAARLELVKLQIEIAKQNHELQKEEHRLKLLHFQNEEIRKQEMHEALLRKMQ